MTHPDRAWLHLPSERTSIRWVSIALVVVSLAGLVRALGLGFSKDSSPGPGFVPVLVFLMLALVGVYIAIRPEAGDELSELLSTGKEKHDDIRPIIATILATLACVLLLPTLGYILTMGLYAFAMVIIAGSPWRAAALTAVILSAAMYLLFSSFLGLRLPTGLW